MKAKAPIIKSIEDVIEPVIVGMGFELVQTSLIGTSNPILQILVDNKTNNISLDECGDISQAIAAILDVENVMGEKAYMLDLGSPGVDRPLTREKDFELFAGRNVKINTDTEIDGKKRFKGLLKGMKDNNVLLEVENEVINIPLNYIDKAKLYTDTDELLQRKQKRKN